MSESRKYFYMRLKEDFFDSDEMIVLEALPDGMIFQNILLKMYCRSLKNEGRLMLNGIIPYNSQMLASVTRQQVGTVEKALDVFQQLGLIEVLDNGAIYMSDIQNYIGSSSTEGDRKREYRQAIEAEKTKIGQMSGQTSTISISKDISISKSIERGKESAKAPTPTPEKPKKQKFVPPTLEEVQAYCKETGKLIDAEYFISYYGSQNWRKANGQPLSDWKLAVCQWWKKDGQKKPEQKQTSYDLSAIEAQSMELYKDL